MKTQTVTKPLVIQWPTLLICSLCYGGFLLSTLFFETLGPLTSTLVLTFALTLFSSFSHEVLHGHPFRSTTVNTLLVFPALGLLIPYRRFRDTHLAHHHDPSLTDPYDDPETNYVDPVVWVTWSPLRRGIYSVNNTLLGRMALGPVISISTFYVQDARAALAGDKRVIDGWLFHIAGVVPVLWWIANVGQMPFWMYLLSVYFSHSILKIRTFLEHCAHEKARCRSVIIEDRGLLSFLFLKNNLHAVHHACPSVPWYRLQSVYASKRASFLKRNGGYAYRSYRQVIATYFLRAKDPVPHTLMAMPPAPQTESYTMDERLTQ